MTSCAKNKLHTFSWHEGIELLEANFKGQPFGKHSHDAFAIGAIEAGVGGYDCRGARHALPQNTLSLMNPDEPHNGYALSSTLQYKMLYASETAVKRLLGTKETVGFREITPKDHGQLVSHRLSALSYRLSAKQHTGWRLAIDTELIELLETVLTRYGRKQPQRSGREPAAVTMVKAYLEAKANDAVNNSDSQCDGVTLENLAKLVDLHPHYFLTVFSQHIGVPPYTYWLLQRIKHAKAMLKEGYPTAEVAYRLGFYDQAHFLRAFKKVTGVTPSRLLCH